MKKQVLKILFILCISVGLTSAVFAQGRQTGSIRGTVGDAGGNSLPGVTVTVSSGALMGDQTYITTEKGYILEVDKIRVTFAQIEKNTIIWKINKKTI